MWLCLWAATAMIATNNCTHIILCVHMYIVYTVYTHVHCVRPLIITTMTHCTGLLSNGIKWKCVIFIQWAANTHTHVCASVPLYASFFRVHIVLMNTFFQPIHNISFHAHRQRETLNPNGALFACDDFFLVRQKYSVNNILCWILMQ